MLARLVALLLVALVVSGCGSSKRKTEEKTVGATVLSFLHNYARGNEKQACALLTAGGRQRLFGAATPAACEKTVRKQTGHHGVIATRTRNQLLAARVRSVVFKSDTRADVQVALPTENAPTAPFRVVKIGGRWLVAGPPSGG